jgi:hypothetical protein
MLFAYLENCKTCISAGAESPPLSSMLLKMGGIVCIIALATFYGWFSYRKKTYLFLGNFAALLVIGSYAFSIRTHKNQEYLAPPCDTTACVVRDSLQSFGQEEFLPVGAEFEDISEKKCISALDIKHNQR